MSPPAARKTQQIAEMAGLCKKTLGGGDVGLGTESEGAHSALKASRTSAGA